MTKKVEAAGRQSNLELLRIVAIFMIVVFHCSFKSGFSFEPGFSANKLIVKSFWMLGELGVNLFMLISGYFMVNGRFKWKKLVRLLAEVQFYNLATFWIGSRLGLFSLSGLRSQFLLLFPVTQNSFWFITAYLLVYILSPYFNLLIRAMDERTYRRLLLIVLVLWCAIPTVFGFFLGGTEGMLYYNRFIWLVIMYFLGAYIYIYIYKTAKIRTFYSELMPPVCRPRPLPSWCCPSWSSTASTAFSRSWAPQSPPISGRPTPPLWCA